MEFDNQYMIINSQKTGLYYSCAESKRGEVGEKRGGEGKEKRGGEER